VVTEIEMIKKTEIEKKAEEGRRKTVVVGDMQPLAESLPTLTPRFFYNHAYTATVVSEVDFKFHKKVKAPSRR